MKAAIIPIICFIMIAFGVYLVGWSVYRYIHRNDPE